MANRLARIKHPVGCVPLFWYPTGPLLPSFLCEEVKQVLLLMPRQGSRRSAIADAISTHHHCHSESISCPQTRSRTCSLSISGVARKCDVVTPQTKEHTNTLVLGSALLGTEANTEFDRLIKQHRR